jgi:hypothetical protein
MKPYYEADGITLYHGDCREIDAWLTADVLVTDPPYGYNHASNWIGAFQNKAIAYDFDLTMRDAALAAWGGKPAVVFGSWKMPKPAGTKALLIWDKGPAAGMGDLSMPWKPNTEEIYILGSGFSGVRDSSILSGNTVVTWASKGRQHPNMKPPGLMERLIAKCPRGVVADPFAGSGSTLVAAKLQGRRAIGVELEEKYCEIAARRLDQGVLDFGASA